MQILAFVAFWQTEFDPLSEYTRGRRGKLAGSIEAFFEIPMASRVSQTEGTAPPIFLWLFLFA